jgi:hypothetical protein
MECVLCGREVAAQGDFVDTCARCCRWDDPLTGDPRIGGRSYHWFMDEAREVTDLERADREPPGA